MFARMGPLLVDQPLPIVEGVALVAVSIGLILASVARGKSTQPGSNRVAQLFWRDASHAGYLWAAATIVLLFGALGEVEGVRTPIWLVLAVVVGSIAVAVVRVRWIRSGLASAESSVDGPRRHDRARVVSTTWEIALLAAGAGALLFYGATASHNWGHPIHWGIALIGGTLGYAIGLTLATPRYTVRNRGT
jgi:hypothetical protein